MREAAYQLPIFLEAAREVKGTMMFEAHFLNAVGQLPTPPHAPPWEGKRGIGKNVII